MRANVKTILALALLFLPVLALADGKVVPYDKLPVEARSFIKEHFGSEKVLQVTSEWNEYEVLFSDMSTVQFDRSGNWKEVKCRQKAIPEPVIPSRILSYVKEVFPGRFITRIERSRRGYEVKLDNGLELEFDRNCNFFRIDD